MRTGALPSMDRPASEPPAEAGEVTELVRRMRGGEMGAAEELLPKIYAELHGMAQRAMRGQRADHTLQTTGLLNEAFLRLCSGSQDVSDRNHFLNVAARAMRSVLVDHARRKTSKKREANGERVLLDDLVDAAEERAWDLASLGDALELLGERDARLAQLVDLRFFVGLSVAETAAVLEISPRQAAREWERAREWLRTRLT